MCPYISTEYRVKIREKIIHSAIKNFAKTGYDRTKMDDIAKTAGLGKGTLYLYFKSKDDLFYAIYEYNLKRLKEQLDGRFNKRKDLVIDAEKLYESLQNINYDVDVLTFEMVAESTRNTKLRKMLRGYRSKIFAIIIELLNEQIEKGFIRKDINRDLLALGLVAIYEGLIINRLLGMGKIKNNRIWTETIRAIIEGIS